VANRSRGRVARVVSVRTPAALLRARFGTLERGGFFAKIRKSFVEIRS
jgi:hypothetical protein